MMFDTLEFFVESQHTLGKILQKRNVCPETIQSIIDDGYYMLECENSFILDRYCGGFNRSIPIDAISDDGFHFEIFRNKEIPIVDVSSVAEAQEYLDRKYTKMNPQIRDRIVYRGQNTSYYLQRKHTNPWIHLRNGKEPSLIPSYWRQKTTDTPIMEEPVNILRTCYADPLIYYGIDVANLSRQNYQKYGPHDISDLADFEDPSSREYYRRWVTNKIALTDITLLAQHYGFPTPCLDVTFDLKVAFFFASHKFQKLDNNKATYRLKPNEDSIVYCLLYTDPALKPSRDMVTEISCFDHLTPKRPLVQSCALVYHNALDINGSAAYILMGFRIKKNFDTSNLPEPAKLFPSPSEDPFYERLLDMKHNSAYKKIWEDVVEYEF